MAEMIVTALFSVFFAIGVYTAIHELYSLIFGENPDDKQKPP